MEGMDELRPEVVADAVIQELIQSGRWEEIRINLASTLHINGDYEAVKRRAQDILSTDQLHRLMQQPTCTVHEIAAKVEKAGGLRQYRIGLQNLVAPDTPSGAEIQREISPMVDRYVAAHT
jgi:hypothetical protein